MNDGFPMGEWGGRLKSLKLLKANKSQKIML